MLKFLRNGVARWIRRYQSLLLVVARPISVVMYPFFEAAGQLHRIGAREMGLRRFKAAGPGVQFDSLGGHIRFEGLEVGSNVFLGAGARIWALQNVRIGNDVMFGPEVYVMDGYHRIDIVGKTIRDSGADERSPVVIGSDVWVGTRSTIMKGVEIGDGTVVGAESLVTKDLPPYVVAGGNPCRVLRKRFSDEELVRHLQLVGKGPREVAATLHARSKAFDEPCRCADCSRLSLGGNGSDSR